MFRKLFFPHLSNLQTVDLLFIPSDFVTFFGCIIASELRQNLYILVVIQMLRSWLIEVGQSVGNGLANDIICNVV